jgi:hypothetical protein
LQVPVPCSPCRQLACPFHLECLDVAPPRLARAALRLAQLPSDVPASDPTPSGVPTPDLPQETRWPPAQAPRIA